MMPEVNRVVEDVVSFGPYGVTCQVWGWRRRFASSAGFRLHGQGGESAWLETTVDHSDIRGFVPAWEVFVVELPHSRVEDRRFRSRFVANSRVLLRGLAVPTLFPFSAADLKAPRETCWAATI